MRRFLVSLSGARDDLLRRTPNDRPRYVAMGGVILSTACVAALSATFALHSAVGFPLVVAILVGIGWGVVVLNLDRMLVVGMTRQIGWRRNLVAALPRLLLALLIGAVMSMPLVLQIFDPEIQVQMRVQDAKRASAFEQQINGDARFAQIPDLERQLAAAENAASTSAATRTAQDPGVRAAQAEVDRARGVLAQTQAAAQCEIDGTCGTGVPGVAAAAEERRRTRDVAAADFDAANRRLADATAAANQSSGTASAAANQDAERLRADLTSRRAALEAARSDYAASAGTSHGLLGRIEALYALGDGRPALGLAHTALFLLFLAIELLPVLSKLLYVTGPQSLYDQLLERSERRAGMAAANDAARDREVEERFRENQRAVEIDRAERQRVAGLRLNEEIVEEEVRQARDAIRR